MVTGCRSRVGVVVGAVVGVVFGVVGVGSLQSGQGALRGVKPAAVVVAAGFLAVVAACFVKRPSVLPSRIQFSHPEFSLEPQISDLLCD